MATPPPPRQCHLTKWADFDGYGFNLHAEKNKPGQFIGKIDPGSPSEAAGLREGDKIVEVNGVNVSQENHKQVVQRIKAIKDETRLLVADKKCEEWHRDEKVVIKNSLPYVIHSSSEKADTIKDEDDEEEEVIDTRLQNVKLDDDDISEIDTETATPKYTPDDSVKAVEREHSVRSQKSTVSVENERSSVSSGSFRSSPSPSSDSPDFGLNLNMTAKEMRELLGSQKKRDPRKDSRSQDMKKKFEMIQAL